MLLPTMEQERWRGTPKRESRKGLIHQNTTIFMWLNLPKMLILINTLTVQDRITSQRVTPAAFDRSRTDLADTNWQVCNVRPNDLKLPNLSKWKFRCSIFSPAESRRWKWWKTMITSPSRQTSMQTFRPFYSGNIQISYAEQDTVQAVMFQELYALIRPSTERIRTLRTLLIPQSLITFLLDPWWRSKTLVASSNPLAIVHFTDDKRNTY
jgi:hypothetical protein